MNKKELLPYLLRDMQYAGYSSETKIGILNFIEELMEINMFGNKFNDLNKLYVAQVIDNSWTKEVSSNWYNDFIGELFIVRVRPNENKTTWTLNNNPETTYEVALASNFHLKNYKGNGFNNADIKILCEYPEIPAPEVPFVLEDGTKVYKKDVEGIIKHFNLKEIK